ncbi:MAG: transglutaminase domain-containing protein [Oscillospiraceae bacterium]|nr:transglutaminase domain-containing protein [Oscillospiraceae bacterium]
MKKRNKKLTVDNGISVSYRVNSNERVKIPFLNDIMLILLTFIAMVGSIMTFATILQLEVMDNVVIPWLAVFSAVFGVLYKLIKKRRWLVFIGSAVLVGLLVLIFWEEVYKGTILLFDQGHTTISYFMAWDDVDLTFEWEPTFYNLTNFVILLFSVLLCTFVSYFIVVKTSFIAIFLLTFPFFEIGAAFGAVPKLFYFSMMVATWAAVLTISRVSNSKSKVKKAGGKKKKKRDEAAKGKFAASAVVIALATICLFVFVSEILNVIDFSRSKDIDKLRKDTKNYATDVYDYITGKDHDGSLKEGKLLEVDDRQIKDRHYFSVETSILWTNKNIRFKGYTASTYNNNEWGQLDSYDEYADLFEKIEKNQYKIAAMNGELLRTYQGRHAYEYSKMRIYDLRRVKNYAFQTYCSIFDDKFSAYKDDLGVSPNNKLDYSYTTYLGLANIYDITKSELYKDRTVSQIWKEYGEFVKAEYTDSYVAPSVKELTDSFNAESRNQLIDKIRSYLKENTKYSHKFNKCPKNKDFVDYFLFDEQRGYSTHYATAAAVMLQSQGYPARYVEGYFIPMKAANNSFINEDGNLIFDVTDKYAHAWIEIYDSTYGWIPVEVTPGYWSGLFEDELEDNINDNSAKEEGQKPEEPKNEVEDDDVNNPDVSDQPPEDNFVGAMGGVSGGRALTPGEKALIAIVVTIVLSIIGWITFHYIYASVRRKKLGSKDANIVINEAYKYFLRLATYEGIDCKNIHSYLVFADECAEKSSYLDREQNRRFFAVLLKNAFSQSGATLGEAMLCAEYANRYAEVMYNALPTHKKFVFKMLKQL